MYLFREAIKAESGFYEMLSPMLGNRAVADEVGIPLWVDDAKRYFVAECEAEFCGLLTLNRAIISDCYVMPKHRRNGILSSLLMAATLKRQRYRATCTTMSLGAFEKQGFLVTNTTVNFTMVEKKYA